MFICKLKKPDILLLKGHFLLFRAKETDPMILKIGVSCGSKESLNHKLGNFPVVFGFDSNPVRSEVSWKVEVV